ncbi:proline iminopeptidase [Quadrisphaera granulorum]|uniref:Proline iminopeptidase n=1 Tax=Quadrisphaera granulorum TaxID=317664 RepID=A0A315ZU34_9ACTN|nr:prolyl aminopeptidase [Quadrisphaera granulorum]PWJ48822.1 proline iminopeptidase [Quadrisphaera granulorum]SZE98304.1 proline iminopeptidase [Quadrisphaera granulorum]
MPDRSHAPIEPYETGYLDVGDGHSLYWEQCGNPDGKPAVVLHGGPGTGCHPGMRQLFDQRRYRVVLFDQRNSGRSRPWAGEPEVDLSANTTPHLVADIEALREHLGVYRWLVWGGSWGVTLGLAYAQAHPARVTELALAAITSPDRWLLRWITRDIGRVFPREWEAFRDGVPPEDRDGDLAAAYSRLLRSPDAEVRQRAAQAWCDWEDTHVSLSPGARPALSVADPAFQLAFARLVTHYWGNGCFLDDGQLLRDAHRLAGIPGVMVHGRYDVSGPLDVAWQLAKAWPDGELVVVEDAGHNGAGIATAVVEFLNRVAGGAGTDTSTNTDTDTT